MSRFIVPLVFLLSAPMALAQVPRLLVAQDSVASDEESEISIPLVKAVAEELESAGVVEPIIYAIDHPLIVEALRLGKVRDLPSRPDLNDAFAASSGVDAEYTLWLHAKRDGMVVECRAKLFRRQRQVWTDEEKMSVQIGGGFSATDTARSVARTWVLTLLTGPLRGLPARPRIPTPEIPAGAAPPVPLETRPAVVDNAVLRENVEGLIREGRVREAVLALRVAVDEEPLSIERRRMLIDLLVSEDQNAASEEAQRASMLFPNDPGLRQAAARSMVRSGELNKALEMANEWVARDPSTAEGRAMLAEIALRKNNLRAALDHATASIQLRPTPDGYRLRALARGASGGKEGALEDLAATGADQPWTAWDADLALTVIDITFRADVDAARSLIQRALVRPNAPEVAEAIESIQRTCESRIAVLSQIRVPEPLARSLDRWLAALQLLNQMATELELYIGEPDSSVLADARISLGEAIKQSNSARSALRPH